MRPIAKVMKLAIQGYRLAISPMLGTNCRFSPSCSAYAIEAIERHGAMRGSWLAARRVMRCHPWGGSGYDPVPADRTSHFNVGAER
jgi:putative membrane protein insertion efficiency factor